MKHILLLAFVFFFASNILSAQNNTTKEPSAKVKSELAILKSADLNLNDMQLLRITSVLTSQEQLLDRNMKVLEGNKTLQLQRMKELKDNKIRNIKGAMTEQQAAKFTALKLEDKF